MTQESWEAVDRYIFELFVPPDPALDEALTTSVAAGLPAIAVAPNQGKLLHLLARMMGARRILEIGTLGGYSTIWLGRALPPGGRLLTLEIDARHAEVARSNLRRAQLDDVVEIIVSPAADTLARLQDEGTEPFDMVFIDADKQTSADYFALSLPLTRPGGIIVVDNVVRHGAVLDAANADPAVAGTRRLNDLMAAEPRVSVTAVQTVGVKGHDGFALALVLPR